MLGELMAPFKGRNGWEILSDINLVPHSLLGFWTGHSARHTLPSLAAACGVSKDERDYLGRWSCAKHGSQDYILTSRQVVHSVQNRVCKFLLEGDPAPGYIEEELQDAMHAHVLGENGNALKVRQRHKVLIWNQVMRRWSLDAVFPMLVLDAGDPEPLLKAPTNTAAAELEEELPDAPYFITISRNGSFHRLHVSKRGGVGALRG